jgi:cell division protein FtsW
MKSPRPVVMDMKIIILAFCAFSVLAMWTASVSPAMRHTGDPLFYFKRHLLAVLAGLFFYALASRVVLKRLLPAAPWLHAASLLLLIAVFLPHVGVEINGARRWIELGFLRFQPSEGAKLTLILYLTASFHKEAGGYRRPGQSASLKKYPLLITAATALLIFTGNDFSTSVLVLALYGVVFFVSGRNPKAILFWASSAFAAGLLILMRGGGFRSGRVASWLEYLFHGGPPAYQLRHSIAAFQMGGYFGRGFGSGAYKNLLPEAHTDFIFSVIGEEMGFIFILGIIALYLLLFYKFIRLSEESKYDYERYFLLMTGSLFAFQSVINMGVTVGLFPVTGMTLPLISYGRTSFLVFMTLLGLARSIEKDIARRMS